MAQVFPSTRPDALPLDAQAARQESVLKALAQGLPADFTVYHGLHWTRLDEQCTVLGRLQFLVVTPAGLMICILMKTGLLQGQEGRLIKRAGDGHEDVFTQLTAQLDLLRSKFTKQYGNALNALGMVYCPDFLVPNVQGLDLEPELVVDSRDRDALAFRVIQLANRPVVSVPAKLPSEQASLRQIQAFLSNELTLVPEVGALALSADTLITRLSQGLPQWVSRLSAQPFRLRVTGTAGCGKTLLALQELQQAHARRERVLVVCYNRPLAVHLQTLVAEHQWLGAQVWNFHALCDRLLKDAGIEPDYSQPDVFNLLPEQVLGLPQDLRWVFDTVVVDEGQDFEQGWVAVLERLAHPASRWLWLEDPAQNLYGKQPVDLPGWMGLTVPVNYRNPRQVLAALDQIKPLFTLNSPELFNPESACPVDGWPVQWLGYEHAVDIPAVTARAVTQCLKMGFDRSHVAVLSWRGHEKSQVLRLAQLGPHSLAHYTGQVDAQGRHVFSQGAVLAESVYRFKGQSAQAVVLTELQLEEMNDTEFRKLFVAMTRATLYLVVVASVGTLAKLKVLEGQG